MNVNKPGDQFSWHYDTNEFTVTLLIQDCEEGGVFQYAPNIRNKYDEYYDDVSALLHGDYSRVKELKLNEGDLQIFKVVMHCIERLRLGAAPHVTWWSSLTRKKTMSLVLDSGRWSFTASS